MANSKTKILWNIKIRSAQHESTKQIKTIAKIAYRSLNRFRIGQLQTIKIVARFKILQNQISLQ